MFASVTKVMEKMKIHTSGNQIIGPLWRVEVWKMETGNGNYSEK
jgi:hypothetical protein